MGTGNEIAYVLSDPIGKNGRYGPALFLGRAR